MNKVLEAVKKGYYVENGKCYNKKGEERGHINNSGYPILNIKINGTYKRVSIHRILAYQKFGDEMFKEGIVVRHLNGDRKDLSFDNIAIGTQSENEMDIPKELRIKYAIHAASFKKKYNNDEVIDYHNSSKSYNKTMEKFGISSRGTLHYILNGRNNNAYRRPL